MAYVSFSNIKLTDLAPRASEEGRNLTIPELEFSLDMILSINLSLVMRDRRPLDDVFLIFHSTSEWTRKLGCIRSLHLP